MIRVISFLSTVLLICSVDTLQGQTIKTGSFHKIIVSPFIEATFVHDQEERVVVDNSVVDPSKLHIETKNGTLRVYLEGAKEIPRKPRENRSSDNQLYPNRAVTLTIYYKTLDALSLRGEEQFSFPGLLRSEKFTLNMYGESAITFAKVHIDDLHATLYGESSIEMESGSVDKQTYICYGEGRINTTDISGKEAKLTAYGEADFRMNVSRQIRITSFGEAKLRYKGDAEIVKRINIGGVDVRRETADVRGEM